MTGIPGDFSRDLIIGQQLQQGEFLSTMRLGNVAMESLRASMVSLSVSITDNVNVISKFQQAVMKSEKLQLQALATGTTLTRFQDANTKALEKFTVAQLQATDFLLTSYSQGLRGNTDELNALANSMILQDQNTQVLIDAMAGLSVVTGDNKPIQSKLITTTEKAAADYGVSTERLLQGLQQFQSQFESFSIYGEEAAGSLAQLAILLQGGTAGKAGAQKQIGVLLSLGDSLNIAQQKLLGLESLFKDVRDGKTIGDKHLAMIVSASEKLRSLTQANHYQAQALSEGIGRDGVQALMMLGGLLKNNYKSTEELKKSAKEQNDSLRAKQQKVDDFYETIAPGIYGFVKQIYYAMLGGAAGAGIAALGNKAARSVPATTAMLKESRRAKIMGPQYAPGPQWTSKASKRSLPTQPPPPPSPTRPTRTPPPPPLPLLSQTTPRYVMGPGGYPVLAPPPPPPPPLPPRPNIPPTHDPVYNRRLPPQRTAFKPDEDLRRRRIERLARGGVIRPAPNPRIGPLRTGILSASRGIGKVAGLMGPLLGFLGPLGFVLGLGVPLITDLLGDIKDSSKGTEESLKSSKPRIQTDEGLALAARFASQQVGVRTKYGEDEMLRLLSRIAEASERSANRPLPSPASMDGGN